MASGREHLNQQLAAVRRLAREAADAGLLSAELAAGISRAKGASSSDSVPAIATVNWSRFSSCSAMFRCRRRSIIFGYKQKLGHPVNDLFDLRTDVVWQKKGEESVPVNGPVTL